MNVRPAGREACNCASPYNSILERLDAMEAEILAVQATANSAMGVANAQAGAAASSASAAAASATAAGNAAISAASDASDALTQATAASGYADAASDSATDALTALQNIEGTIASVLASDIGGKVDKLTTAGFYLYMHNGSTQGEVQPVVAPTAATIPIRDSDGRMQAADPASGATDKTLVTANWVSQTGSGRPNNVIHDGGDEDMAGNKNVKGVFSNMAYRHNYAMVAVNTGGKYVYLFTVDSSTLRASINMKIIVGYSYSDVTMDLRNGLASIGISSYAVSGERYLTADAIIACTNDASNKKWDIYMKYPQNRKIAVYVETVAATFGLDEYNPANVLTGTFTGTLIDDPSGDYLEVVTSAALTKVV